jgi:retron-type reverse transcriptase
VTDKALLAYGLASSFLSGEWSAEGMEASALSALSLQTAPQWLRNMVAEIRAEAATPYAPSEDRLTRLILDSRALHALAVSEEEFPEFEKIAMPGPRFLPTPAFRDCGIPELVTLHDLSTWLNLPVGQIEWFADVEGYRATAASDATRHYRHSWRPRKLGPPRLIEAPKPLLKGIQRKILDDILARVPVHDCAHGFRRKRSCIGAAQLHAGEAVVVTVDLKDYFPNIPIRSVHGLFRSLGYPWNVARYLTGLCSTATPADVFERLPQARGYDWEARKPFLQQHLPQGAPTSPALANLCSWRLDCRLDGLARRLDARYTRYGDDLAFSGSRDFADRTGGFLLAVAAICEDTGHSLNPRKTRIMRNGARQQITGLVVNRHVNVPRDRYDRLKATLNNCVRHGPAGQNRDGHPDFRAHLDGRITWVETVNLRRGHRLRLLFQQIEWP